MILDAVQVEAFQSRGYLFFESVFSPQEIACLREAMPQALEASPERDYEPDGTRLRMCHGLHMYHDMFRCMSRHPRLLGPVGQLLGEELYIYQSRLNLKMPYEGQAAVGYPWHQDYSTWHFRDGLRRADLVVAIVFLDEITACNAPLMLIPGSHRAGLNEDGVAAQQREMVTIPPETLAAFARRGGVEAQMGPAGSVLLMHANTMHASGENIAPLRRCTYSTVFAQVGNYPTRNRASAQLVPQSFPRILPERDDCLMPTHIQV